MKNLWHTKPVMSIALRSFDFHTLQSTLNDFSDAKSEIKMMQRSILRRPHVIIHHSPSWYLSTCTFAMTGKFVSGEAIMKNYQLIGGYKCKTTGSLMMFHVAIRIMKPNQVLHVIAILILKTPKNKLSFLMRQRNMLEQPVQNLSWPMSVWTEMDCQVVQGNDRSVGFTCTYTKIDLVYLP